MLLQSTTCGTYIIAWSFKHQHPSPINDHNAPIVTKFCIRAKSRERSMSNCWGTLLIKFGQLLDAETASVGTWRILVLWLIRSYNISIDNKWNEPSNWLWHNDHERCFESIVCRGLPLTNGIGLSRLLSELGWLLPPWQRSREWARDEHLKTDEIDLSMASSNPMLCTIAGLRTRVWISCLQDNEWNNFPIPC